MSEGVTLPPGLRLVVPSGDRVAAYVQMVELAHKSGDADSGFSLVNPIGIRHNPQAYLRRLRELERGEKLPGDTVPMRTRWLLDADDALVGEARIRQRLTPSLEIEGGHVGYFIHPHHRGLGYGNAILTLSLHELAEIGVSLVLVTCNADNARSRRVIERNGGQFYRYTRSPRSGKQVMTFWIENA